MKKPSVIVNPESLAGCAFLMHGPQNELQAQMLEGIKEALRQNLPAVKVLWVDPAEEDGKLVFEWGKEAAVNHTFPWWKQKAESYNPAKNSRLCTDLYWYVLLGMQVNYLVEKKNYSVERAMYAVCNEPRDLSVPMLRTFKLLETWDGCKPVLAGGHCAFAMRKYPLAYLKRIFNMDSTFSHAVGLIMEDI